MWLCKYGTARKDICKTKLKQRFHSYCFFKASLWKVCEACPELFIRLNFPMISHCFIQNPAFESSEEKYYPHNFSAKRPRIGTIVKNHIQSSSCLFRTTLFVCSESDTSLMNYIIPIGHPVMHALRAYVSPFAVRQTCKHAFLTNAHFIVCTCCFKQ